MGKICFARWLVCLPITSLGLPVVLQFSRLLFMINAFAAGQQFFKFDLYKLASRRGKEKFDQFAKAPDRRFKLTQPYIVLVIYRSQRHFTVLILLAWLIGKEIIQFFIAIYCWRIDHIRRIQRVDVALCEEIERVFDVYVLF